ncbi:M23 family metallopeptidase [Rathayibacter sp. VKM Ac-2630]|uniref:M23 family metallopeptidase n=1 Tax=Rathayibacter sp. VKM Ac-2630 TaxID=1938617 RepID=UPI000980A9D8|nr:M23 family metallopeptidase [Rathayibacter sp. VKM Ac-2630]OOB90283.1 hypothetical protein B0T42_12335 [Rathayibacter sp. VKM Ac-2630]
MPVANWRAFYDPSNFRNRFREQGPYYSSFGHRGLDIAAAPRQAIPVWAPGTVYVISSTGGLGPVVGIRIDDSDKRAAWAHLWGITVAVGQHVEPGDVVATPPPTATSPAPPGPAPTPTPPTARATASGRASPTG